MDLTKKKCIPCEAGTEPFSEKQADEFLKQISGWELKNGHLYKKFKFKNFVGAMKFVNAVANIAEQEGHHPDILLFGWNKVKLTLSTHAIKGLSDNDFILAAKIDEIRSI